MDNKHHIIHCLEQLVRFSLMFKTNTVDSPERRAQFGYNLGRLIVLCRKSGLTTPLISQHDTYTVSIAKMMIDDERDVNSATYHFEKEMINFGFAIGFMQEWLEHSHEIWWKPISQLCAEKSWHTVVAKTKDTLSQYQHNITMETHLDAFYIVGAFDVLGISSLGWDDVYQTFVNARTELNI